MTSTTTDRRNGINASKAVKVPCRVATTANITLEGLQTIDGVSLAAGDRVLVKSQSDGTQNGIYEADTSEWSRTPDFDGQDDVVTGTYAFVTAGSTMGNKFWGVTTADPVIGTTAIDWQQVLGTQAVSSYWSAIIGLTSNTQNWAGTAGGTANALTLTPSPAIAAYEAGQSFNFIAAADNTATGITVAVSGRAAKAIKKYNRSGIADLEPGDIESGGIYTIVFNGVNDFILTSRQAVGGPRFSAYSAAGQTIGAGATAKVQFNTEDFDSHGNFDSTVNFRFTPLVPGKYLVGAAVTLSSIADTKSFTVLIYKNGVNYKQMTFTPGNTSEPSGCLTIMVDMNGTTDYLEVFAINGDSSSRTVAATQAKSYFWAERLPQ